MTRLNHKFALAFTLSTIIVLGIALTVTSEALKRSTIQNTIGTLYELNLKVEEDIKESPYTNLTSKLSYTKIEPISEKEFLENHIKDSKHHAKIYKAYNDDLLTNVDRIEVNLYTQKNNHFYKITSIRDQVEMATKYLDAILLVFVWIFVFLITLSIVVSNVISMYILEPFYTTLEIITQFRVKDTGKITFKENSTFEFRKLNRFLENMMRKSRSDYQALKEFSENASHELQTPLAIMKAKIDNLIQTPLIESQLKDLDIINQQIYKLSKIKTSLTTLMHLENYEPKFQTNNLSEILLEKIEQLGEVMEMNEIKFVQNIEKNCFISMEKNWIDITLNNLLNNAIKHNNSTKYIEVILTPNQLIIKNTGDKPLHATQTMFDRFKSNSKNSNSTGIGLSIVQKIMEIHNYTIHYLYQENLHIIKIEW